MSSGLATCSVQPLTASLLLADTPVGYTPARGPALPFTLTYNHRDQLQPQIFTYTNLGPKWTFSTLRFAQEQPTDAMGVTPPHVWVQLPAGGREVYLNPDAQGVFPVNWRSRATLVRVSASPARYERRLADGSVEVYTHGDGAPVGRRRVFLTQLIDPQQQVLQFIWDAQFRLVAIVDALGQVTTLGGTGNCRIDGGHISGFRKTAP